MPSNMTVTVGLVSFAAKTEPARIPKPEVRNLCTGMNGKPHDPLPLTAPATCTTCGPLNGDYSSVVKGVKQGSTYAVVTQEEITEAKVQHTEAYKRKFEAVVTNSNDFLAKTAPGKGLYYITPAAGSEDHYQMIVRLVRDHPELAFTSLYTPSSVAALYRLVVRDDVLCMEERTREQAMKPLPTVGGTVNESMYGLLETVLDKMAVPYDPDTFEDQYALTLAKLAVEAQDHITVGAGGVKKDTTALVKASDVDLMAKLAALAKS